jgi:hypothetical protein
MKKVIWCSITFSPYVKTLGNQINAPLFVKDFPMVPIAQQDVFWFWEPSTWQTKQRKFKLPPSLL